MEDDDEVDDELEDEEILEYRASLFFDISEAIPLAYQDLMGFFDSDYQLYQDSENEKLEWIDSTISELRENLVESPFKVYFPLNVVKDNLLAELADFCFSWQITLSDDYEYMVTYSYDDNSFETYNDEKYDYKDLFSYVSAEQGKSLVLHIALYQIYIELKKRKAEILEKSAMAHSTAVAETPFNQTAVGKASHSYSHACQLIFKDPDARMIFEYLQTNVVGEKTLLADYTFVFRRMQRDGYILEEIKEKYFRDFLSRHFQIEINSKLKPEGYNITELKEKIYANAIRLIQTK